MYRWMDGSMDHRWMDGWIDRWMVGPPERNPSFSLSLVPWASKQANKQEVEANKQEVDGTIPMSWVCSIQRGNQWWIDGWMDRWIDGSMERWMDSIHRSIHRSIHPSIIDFVVELNNWLIGFVTSTSCLFACLLAQGTRDKGQGKRGIPCGRSSLCSPSDV